MNWILFLDCGWLNQFDIVGNLVADGKPILKFKCA